MGGSELVVTAGMSRQRGGWREISVWVPASVSATLGTMIGSALRPSLAHAVEEDRLRPALARMREAFASGVTRPLGWRVRQLDGLRRLLAEHEGELLQALAADLGKPALEASFELGSVASEVAFARKRVARWMRPERVSTPLIAQPGRSLIQREPLGLVLIMGAWNYPVNLLLAPLVGALAAGNCVALKPSEQAPETSALLARLIPRHLDPACVQVFEGGLPETTALLAERFDHILYTGGPTAARAVLEAAARHLTPVTLELGGKSPVIVDDSANLEVAARRILWCKLFNVGQTCLAPDYVLVPRRLESALIERFQSTLRAFYGEDPRRSPDLGRIVNAHHFRRLVRLLDSGEVVAGGQALESERYIAPTILRDVSWESPIMAEEIFGPLLPVIAVSTIDEAIARVAARPRPLALYLFCEDRRTRERIIERTSSGGCTINHVGLHASNPHLPFGGVGPSGMGAYHGHAGFETFSHRKAVLVKGTRFDPSWFYPPYGETKQRWIRRLL
jgi:aldehyde dehydrogenase (NAD+)